MKPLRPQTWIIHQWCGVGILRLASRGVDFPSFGGFLDDGGEGSSWGGIEKRTSSAVEPLAFP
jgi:hypothetical protein